MIGYYVHHHGAGHVQRFRAVREHLGSELVGLGSGPRPRDLPESAWIALDHDADPADGTAVDETAGGALHWAPLRHDGLRRRALQLAAWVAEARPRALVVDVSVEVTMLARLLSVPTVVIAQHGAREDHPHRSAYAAASTVCALWHETQAPDPPGARRVRHIGPVSRFDDRIAAPRSTPTPSRSAEHADGRRALLLLGAGGHDVEARAIERARRATPDWTWQVAAPPPLGHELSGPDELWTALLAADVVIAPASNNCVAEVGAARRPLIALPQTRPFDEQIAHAELLRAEGLATVAWLWPADEAWGDLLDDTARRSVQRWKRHVDGLGARRLADAIVEVARA